MHDAAFGWVERCVRMLPRRESVLEIGSRNVNGSIRPLFAHSNYWGIDWAPGPGVDEIADGAVWKPGDRQFDTVVSTECMEHAPDPGAICRTAFEVLSPGGVFIMTAAGLGRPPHSGIDGGQLRPGEWYANIEMTDLRKWLDVFLLSLIDDRTTQCDIYAFAVKG